MEENTKSLVDNEMANKEAPRLVALLKEMKDGLDAVKSKVQALTTKVKENHFPTVDGLSYLDAKHLLLLSYCESIVYYLLRKAKGLSIEGHPVVQSLVEIRLFLEKIRPIDKKLQYQTQKLMRSISNATEKVGSDEKKTDTAQNADDPLKYRPNPDLLISKINQSSQDGDGVYRPPKFAPTTMEEDKTLKQEKLVRRKMKETLRQAEQSDFVRKMMDDFEGRPEEVRESFGAESGELRRYKAKMEERARQEEELFIRAPLTKMEKKREKHLKKSRNGLRGLTDDFYDEIRTLPLEDDGNDHTMSFRSASSGGKNHSKRKRQH
ncbi:neuroguidin [Macadamia integrifolia]|uniref:neuroguidin n=1 Tax=Macadamia integrifolia TaxID=60698 RepID=UPI001C529DBC|nr:neuroguidin [Macadamia integrifolia]